jgi:hypothetical protein
MAGLAGCQVDLTIQAENEKKLYEESEICVDADDSAKRDQGVSSGEEPGELTERISKWHRSEAVGGCRCLVTDR